jgi:hypothetical protein
LIELSNEEEYSALRDKAVKLFGEIPIIVKSREPHQFIVLEIFLQIEEKRAFSKLRDVDFISYKLLKLLKSIVSKTEANDADML